MNPLLLARRLALALVLVGAGGGCSRSQDALGLPVDAASAQSLAAVLERAASAPGGDVTVRGRVGEVCRSAGCWLVLRDADGASLRELYVDLQGADFRVEPDVIGREALVRGELEGSGSDLSLRADGLLLVNR